MDGCTRHHAHAQQQTLAAHANSMKHTIYVSQLVCTYFSNLVVVWQPGSLDVCGRSSRRFMSRFSAFIVRRQHGIFIIVIPEAIVDMYRISLDQMKKRAHHTCDTDCKQNTYPPMILTLLTIFKHIHRSLILSVSYYHSISNRIWLSAKPQTRKQNRRIRPISFVCVPAKHQSIVSQSSSLFYDSAVNKLSLCICIKDMPNRLIALHWPRLQTT